MARDAGPERRTMPIPPRPGGVEMATMVSIGNSAALLASVSALEPLLFVGLLTLFSSWYRVEKIGVVRCGVLQGFLQKLGCKTWYFGGQNVVVCMVNVVIKNTHAGVMKDTPRLSSLFFVRRMFGVAT